MDIRLTASGLASLAILASACGGGGGGTDPTPPPPPPPPTTTIGCAGIAPLVLAPGGHQVVDPAATNGCVVLPAPTGPQAEYLVVPVSGNGQVTTSGVVGPFALQVGGPATSPPPSPSALRQSRPSLPEAFDGMLRAREEELRGRYTGQLESRAPAAAPAVGEQRTFNVCGNLACSSFVPVEATARVVGTRAAIFVDNTVPGPDTLQQADLDDLSRTFDNFHFDISTDAFGLPSDIDGNGVIMILLTNQVNDLTPDCTNGRILGFFFGGDLIPTAQGSNVGEIFYALVPAPETAGCKAISRKGATDAVKRTLIHEYQHMISWNQHVILRNGPSERTWLNEGLSHAAEELAGRLIPDAECVGFPSCRSLYTSGDLFNAFDYLSNTEVTFMVSPGSSNGTLEERGAQWLFVRWVADQFATDPAFLGSNVTRALLQTAQVGSANVEAVTGQPFPTLVAEWLLATFLDDLPNFTPSSPRITYRSWGFRSVFAANAPPNGTAFDRPFPTVPDVVIAPGPFTKIGNLRGGSGRHFRILVPAGSGGAEVQVFRNTAGVTLDPALFPRIGVARVQ